MNVVGLLVTTQLQNGRKRFQLEIRNDTLMKYKVIKGDDTYVVHQKAEVELARWEQLENKIEERSRRQHDFMTTKERDKAAKEENKEMAESRTFEANRAHDDLKEILKATLVVDDCVDWESLLDKREFAKDRPAPPKQPPPPIFAAYPRKPLPDDFAPSLSLFDKLLSGRKAKKQALAHSSYLQAGETWQADCERIHADNSRIEADHKDLLNRNAAKYEYSLKEWDARRVRFEEEKAACNAAIRNQETAYKNRVSSAILDYCDLVLSKSQYPEYFSQSFELEFNPENGILIIEYQLPRPSDLPTLKEVKYQPSKDEFVEKHITSSQLQDLYDSAIYQVALRTIHEIFEADAIDAIKAVAFNGRVQGIDPATGQEINPCVLSLQSTKDEFLVINLALVDPKTCFKKLKGIASSQLHSLTPIAPVLQMEKSDRRFVNSYSVVEELGESYNLASMKWEDFEHLIRELFEKEFAHAGGEVKVTRASRDGGVDAVIFDPDPIRGGKIVVQAKRYTNTVGVSAVRDLFGTVVNEGANKGILVATSDYGPDAYEFVRGKPLVLINGNNLLHLLEKHGHKARIDLEEAKRLAQTL